MASPSPTKDASVALGQTMRPRWSHWQFLPLVDEETRQKRAHDFVRRAPYLFCGSVAVIAIGSFIEPLPSWQALALCLCGLIGAKFQLIGLRATNSEKFLIYSGVLTAAAVVHMPNQDHRTFLSTIGVGMFTSAYGVGTMSLLFWLFREPFLQYVATRENPSVPTVTATAETTTSHSQAAEPPQPFDY